MVEKGVVEESVVVDLADCLDVVPEIYIVVMCGLLNQDYQSTEVDVAFSLEV